MSIIQDNNTQIQRLKNAISNSFAACRERNATIPTEQIISELPDCIRGIPNIIPDNYIDAAKTKIYATKFNCGTYTPGADTAISAVNISTIGFKPKIFVIRHFTGYNTTGTRPYVNNSWMVLDNNYEYTLHYPDGGTTNQARTGGTTAFTLSSSKAQSAQSNGAANVFWPTTNGVAGNGGSGSYYLKANITYFWFAWG